MAKNSAADRRVIARIAGLTNAARHDAAEMTAPARSGFLARFEREADPEGVLTPEERERRATLLLRAHMSRLGRKASKKKARQATGRRVWRDRQAKAVGSQPDDASKRIDSGDEEPRGASDAPRLRVVS
jgi:hypothetical protein